MDTINFNEGSSQDSWSEWNDGTITPPIQWRRFDKGGKRFYYAKDGEQVKVGIGITSAIGKMNESQFLRKWKDDNPNWKELLVEYSNYGTLLHIALSQLCKDRKVSQIVIDTAQKTFGKLVDFQKDCLALRKFLIDYNVEPIFIEGIVAKEYMTNSGDYNYVCSAVDLFCKLDVVTKKKEEVEDGFYVRGVKKGQPKFKTETIETVERKMALIDLKSNFHAKETKSYFDSHIEQLIFGRQALCENFNIDIDDVMIGNLSPLGWKTEPKYLVKFHEDSLNKNGYTKSQILDAKLRLCVMEDILAPKGVMMTIGDIEMDKESIVIETIEEFVNNQLEN